MGTPLTNLLHMNINSEGVEREGKRKKKRKKERKKGKKRERKEFGLIFSIIFADATGPSVARPTMDLNFRFDNLSPMSSNCHATALEDLIEKKRLAAEQKEKRKRDLKTKKAQKTHPMFSQKK